MLFSFQLFENLPHLSVTLGSIPLWSENTLYPSSLLNLLRFVLCPRICSMLDIWWIWKVSVLCWYWMNYSMLIGFWWLRAFSSFSISLVVFCLAVPSIILRETVKSLTLLVNLPIFPFSSIRFLFLFFVLQIFFSSVVWCIHILNCYALLGEWALLSCDVLLRLFFVIKFTISDIDIATAFFWLTFAWHFFKNPVNFKLLIYLQVMFEVNIFINRQLIIWSYFLIYPVDLIGTLKLFTFNIIIGM